MAFAAKDVTTRLSRAGSASVRWPNTVDREPIQRVCCRLKLYGLQAPLCCAYCVNNTIWGYTLGVVFRMTLKYVWAAARWEAFELMCLSIHFVKNLKSHRMGNFFNAIKLYFKILGVICIQTILQILYIKKIIKSNTQYRFSGKYSEHAPILNHP